MKSRIISLLLLLFPFWSASAQDNSFKVGSVHWGKDFPGALAESESTGRLVLLLFQEVPGCSGCRSFGKNVLTDSLLVEAIEDEILPVLVYINRSSGMDKNC